MRLLSIVFSMFLLVGCQEQAPVSSSGGSGTKSESQQKPAAVTKAEFNLAGAPVVRIDVPDIHCESCVAHVAEALSEQPGVKQVMVDLEEKVASVAIDAEKFKSADALAALADYQFANSKLIEEDTTEPQSEEEPAEEAASSDSTSAEAS